MSTSINRTRAYLFWGPLVVSLYFVLWGWGLSYHGRPCCRFYLELGPLEIILA